MKMSEPRNVTKYCPKHACLISALSYVDNLSVINENLATMRHIIYIFGSIALGAMRMSIEVQVHEYVKKCRCEMF